MIRPRVFVAIAAALGSCALAPPAFSDEPAPETPPASEAPPKPAPRKDDTSTKRASFEMATYRDSDHVTVFTPSISGTVENVTTGASLSGSYLVDVVSAASVDVVSTASRKWQEVRQAGAVAGEYKPKNFGVAVA